MRALCRLDELPEGGARGFPPAPGGLVGLLLVRRGGAARVYANVCPHLGVALDRVPGRFLAPGGADLRCGTHGAAFSADTGECLDGPCRGDRLTAIDAVVADGMVLVADDAGL